MCVRLFHLFHFSMGRHDSPPVTFTSPVGCTVPRCGPGAQWEATLTATDCAVASFPPRQSMPIRSRSRASIPSTHGRPPMTYLTTATADHTRQPSSANRQPPSSGFPSPTYNLQHQAFFSPFSRPPLLTEHRSPCQPPAPFRTLPVRPDLSPPREATTDPAAPAPAPARSCPLPS